MQMGVRLACPGLNCFGATPQRWSNRTTIIMSAAEEGDAITKLGSASALRDSQALVAVSRRLSDEVA